MQETQTNYKSKYKRFNLWSQRRFFVPKEPPKAYTLNFKRSELVSQLSFANFCAFLCLGLKRY